MEAKKSLPRIYADLVIALYRDIAQCYSVTPRTQRVEIRVIESRCRAEGISFFTKCLPALGKAVDTALATGMRFSTRAFCKESPHSVVPKFLGWLLNRVFDTAGSELINPDPIALKHFRQLVYLLYKLEIPYEKTTSMEVVRSFVEVDEKLPGSEDHPHLSDLDDPYDFRTCRPQSDEWLAKARALVARVIAPIDPTGEGFYPSHGPGAVATGECVLTKSNLRRIYSHLEPVYPFTEYMMFNMNHVAQAIPAEDPRVELVDKATAKVVLVPKDSRGPRLISCEPLEVQWIQQGLKKLLVERIESYPLTRGKVNFTDQTINRRLALEGSKTGKWVTLDMKEASDRVSLSLVKYLFQDNPNLLAALLAARSPQTRLPDGTVFALNKFAPMGSAVCFPVEALVFWALAVSAIRLTYPALRKEGREVYVYGDDIIVSDKVYTTLLHHFPKVGLRFNDGKCCTARSFRESCGCDAYEGIDVTPIKLKTVWSRRRQTNPKCLASYVALRNAMYGQGHFHVVDTLDSYLEDSYGVIPFTNHFEESDNGSFTSLNQIGRVCHEPAVIANRGLRSRVNPQLQRLEYFTWSSVPLKRKTRQDGYHELLRRQSASYGPHGGVYALVRRNRLKRTWLAAW